MQDAPIEDIARAVGINKVADLPLLPLQGGAVRADPHQLSRRISPTCLDEVPATLGPVELLEEGWRRYTGFCLQHPAFLDCGLSLMRGPAEELRETISDAVWIRLAQSMAGCLGRLSQILAQGAEQGVFTVEDPDFTANYLYTQTLGTMHLARVRHGCARRSQAVSQSRLRSTHGGSKRPASPMCSPRSAPHARACRAVATPCTGPQLSRRRAAPNPCY